MAKNDDKEREARRLRRKKQGIILALTAFVLGAAVFGPGFADGSAEGATLPALLFIFAAGVMVALMRLRGWHAWLICTFVGYVVGLSDAWRLLGYREEIVGAYDAALVSAFVLATIGFLGGLVAEFIRFLHTLSHDVRENKADEDDHEGEWHATTTN